MQEQPRPILKFNVVMWILIGWGAVFYFIWKPLIIPALVLFSGYGATYLREKLICSLSYFRPILSGLVWGVVLGFGLYYTNNLIHSPIWWMLVNYFFGFLAAGYVGYRNQIETEMLAYTKFEKYYLISQLTAIIFYVLTLILLHFIFQ